MTAFTTTAALEQLSTQALVAMFNDLTGQSVKRFSSRAVAIARIQAAAAPEVAAPAAPSITEQMCAPEAAPEAPAEVVTVDDLFAVVAHEKMHTCPKCGATEDITPAGLEGTAAEQRDFCHHCRTEWFPETGKIYKAPAASANRSAAISASWKDPAVAAARAERKAVSVVGGRLTQPTQFPSTPAAFRALGLPIGKCIKFRGQLKAAGKLAIGDFTFTVVN